MTYAPQINERRRKHLKSTNDSWKVDETYIKVNGDFKYLYRAIDSSGQIIDSLLTAKRDAVAAKRFLKKTIGHEHLSLFCQTPKNFVIFKFCYPEHLMRSQSFFVQRIFLGRADDENLTTNGSIH